MCKCLHILCESREYNTQTSTVGRFVRPSVGRSVIVFIVSVTLVRELARGLTITTGLTI